MTLDPALATVVVAGLATVIAAVIKFGPARNGFMPKGMCDERTNRIFETLTRIEKRFEQFEQKLDAHIAHGSEV